MSLDETIRSLRHRALCGDEGALESLIAESIRQHDAQPALDALLRPWSKDVVYAHLTAEFEAVDNMGSHDWIMVRKNVSYSMGLAATHSRLWRESDITVETPRCPEHLTGEENCPHAWCRAFFDVDDAVEEEGHGDES